jgi:hypothetical protein
MTVPQRSCGKCQRDGRETTASVAILRRPLAVGERRRVMVCLCEDCLADADRFIRAAEQSPAVRRRRAQRAGRRVRYMAEWLEVVPLVAVEPGAFGETDKPLLR